MPTRIGYRLFATAIAASVVAHALVLASLKSVQVGRGEPARELETMMVVYAGPETRPAETGSEFDIGAPNAKGYATHDLEGRQEQQAREAPQDQPSLSLDPVGLSRMVEVPSSPGDSQHTPPPVNAPSPAVSVASLPRPPIEPALPRDITSRTRQEQIERLAATVPPEVRPPQVSNDAVAFAPPAAPAPQSPPTPAGSGADPAPQSDSESDAFSVLGSVQFRAGRVIVQSGRQVKTRRPRIGLAGMVELAQRSTAQVELKVSVDAAGKVTDVDVARSSGSNDIDQPCRVAMYDWWFEPKKDRSGRAVPDVFRFTISFR
jgi:TonB family protein